MAQPTDYELQREKRIRENKRKMEEMGLLAASRGLASDLASRTVAHNLAAGSEPAPRCKRRRAEPVRGHLWIRLLLGCKWATSVQDPA